MRKTAEFQLINKVIGSTSPTHLKFVTPVTSDVNAGEIYYTASKFITGELVDPNLYKNVKDGVTTNQPIYSLGPEDGWFSGVVTRCGYKLKIAIHFPEGLRAIGTTNGKDYALEVSFERRIRYSINGGAWTSWSTPVKFRVGPSIIKDAFTEIIDIEIPEQYRSTPTTPIEAEVALRRISFDCTELANKDLRYQYRANYQSITSYQAASNDSFVLRNPTTPTDTKLAKTAFRIKATNQVNGTLDGINCIVQTIAKVWTGSTPQGTSGTWAFPADAQENPLGTSNPAALFLYVLTHPGNPRRVSWSNINNYVDMLQIQRWFLYCNNKHFNSSNTAEILSRRRIDPKTNKEIIFEYNDVIAQQKGILEVLRDICAAGRASPLLMNNKWTVVIDEPKDLITQHFTPHNSWGFEANKVLPKRPDALKIQYFDETRDYQQKEILVVTPGFTEETAELFETLSFVGITSKELAEDHGQWHYAQTLLRPEIYTLNTDIEYLVCSRGDRVKVSHDIPMWGMATGRIKNINNLILELDEEIELLANKNYTIRIRTVDSNGFVNSLATNIVPVQVDGYHKSITLTSSLSGVQPQDLFMIGEQNKESHDLLVIGIEPANNTKSARLTLVDYAESLFTSYKTLTELKFDPDITNLPPAQVDGTGGLTPIILIQDIRSDETVMKQISPGNFQYSILIPFINIPDIKKYSQISHVEAELRLVIEGGFGTPIIEKTTFDANNIRVFGGVQEGETYNIRLRYVTKSLKTGLWSPSIDHTVVGKTNPPSDVTGLQFLNLDGNKMKAYWDQCPNIDYDYTELRFMQEGSSYTDPVTNITYTYENPPDWDIMPKDSTGRSLWWMWDGKASQVVADRPAVNAKYKIFAKHRDVNGNYSKKMAIVIADLQAPADVENLKFEQLVGGKIKLSWKQCDTIDYDYTEVRLVSEEDSAVVIDGFSYTFDNPPAWNDMPLNEDGSVKWLAAKTKASEIITDRPIINTRYNIFVKHRDIAGNYSIAYIDEEGERIIGDAKVIADLKAPENVTNFIAELKPVQVSITWKACNDINYDLTELKYISENSAYFEEPIWDEATPLWSGKSVEYLWARPPNGTYKILAKHKNIFGSYSPVMVITSVTVTDLINAVSYDVEIESTKGTIFRLGLGTTTTLIAHVYENTVEVTSILPKYRFKWRRVSSDPTADLIWNDLYAPNKANNVGYKQIEISVDEVNASATFHCDILTDE